MRRIELSNATPTLCFSHLFDYCELGNREMADGEDGGQGLIGAIGDEGANGIIPDRLRQHGPVPPHAIGPLLRRHGSRLLLVMRRHSCLLLLLVRCGGSHLLVVVGSRCSLLLVLVLHLSCCGLLRRIWLLLLQLLLQLLLL